MENNNETNEFSTVFTVETEQGFSSKLEKIKKQMRGIPDDVPLRFTAETNFSKMNKDIKKGVDNWNKIAKKHAGNPVMNYFFGNKRKANDTKKLFNHLSVSALKTFKRYSAELDKLQGKNRDKNPYGGAWGDTKDAIDKSEQKYMDLDQKLKGLMEQRDQLLKQKDDIDLLPNQQKTLKQIEQLRNELKAVDTEKNALTKRKTSSILSSDKADNYRKDIMKGNKEVALRGVAEWNDTGEDTIFQNLMKDIKADTNLHTNAYNKTMKELKDVKKQYADAQKAYNEALQVYGANPTQQSNEQLVSTENNLKSIRNRMDTLNTEKNKANILKNIDKNREKQAQHYWDKKDKYNVIGENKNLNKNRDIDAIRYMGQINKGSKGLNSALSQAVPNEVFSMLDEKKQDIQNKIATLMDTVNNLPDEDIMRLGNQQDIDKVNGEIDKTQKEQKQVQQETDKLWKTYQSIYEQVVNIHTEWQKLLGDMQNDLMQTDLMNKDMSKMNNEIDNVNSKWNVFLGGLKKSNVFTRIGRRVLINIRSQIASMINPLNLWNKGWNEWLNRFDNMAWKNTFDVIKYNLITAFAPLFEGFAKGLIKLAQILNVFTMKWAGVNLFDKSAWQLEQMKKGVGSLTASFDELHSSTDNPDQFNTIFDKDNIKVSPLSEEMTKKLEKWADRIANAFKWIGKNWKWLVGLWAAFKLAQGLLNLTNWAKNLAGLFGKTLPGSLSTFLKGLGLVAGAAASVYSIYENTKFTKNYDQMSQDERNKSNIKATGAAAIGGGLIGAVIGGPLGAVVGAGIGTGISALWESVVYDLNGNDSMAELTAAVSGAGLGMSVGAVIGTAIGGPVGTVVGGALGAAIGGAIGWASEKIGHSIFSSGGAFSNLKISQDDLTWATEKATEASNKQREALTNLKQLEEQCGQSGKSLYDGIQDGTLRYEDLTSAQLKTLKAYEDYQKTVEDTAEAVKTQTDYENAMLMTKAKESGDWSEFISSMQTACDNGIYTSEEMQDRLSQVYSELHGDARDTFVNQIPEDMRQGVEDGAQQYKAGWEKFGEDCSKNWQTFKENWSNFWNDVGTGISTKWDEIKTNAGQTWEDMKTTAGNIWQSIQIEAADAWDKIKNSAIGQKVQEIAADVQDKWEQVKTKASETWENIKSKATDKWEEIKNSAIGQKVQNIYNDIKSKFDEIKNNLSTAWNTLKSDASTAWDNIKNSIVDSAKRAWDGAKGFFSKIGKGVQDAWNGLKGLGERTGQRFGNFFSGKGFKTDQEYEEFTKRHNLNSYDVGTNYVPNDQLAMIHQGEAIIPKKYNKPYQPSGDNSTLYDTINMMSNEIGQLRSLIQQGIPVKGEFKQRGSDLVAVVEKGKNKNGNQPLSNPAYAR